MDPVGSLAVLIPSVCALALAVLAVRQRARIRNLDGQLASAGRTDPLTGLLNRRAFEQVLELELERAARANRPVSVLVGDIDGFSALNERAGREVGDAALRDMAANFLKWKRRIDHAARIGGDQFALLLPETDERGALIVAERLRRATHRSSAESSQAITFSFGMASAPGQAADAVGLLRCADRATAAAQALGGDRSVVYSEEVARAVSGPVADGTGQVKLATMVALAEALDIRDSGTRRHCHTVGGYAELIALELGFEPEHVERVRLAGVLHDVGKVGISDHLVSKPGPLDCAEWQEMYTHPEIGARLLARSELEDLRSWILAHHERPDGLGYPFGLQAAEIPLEASILAVADAYEAMRAERSYRPALSADAARAELDAGAGTQFDAEVVAAFGRALDGGRVTQAPGVA